MSIGPEEIKSLAEALKNLQPESATVNAASVKLPAFWSGNPEVWFKQVESNFTTRSVNAQKTKFDYVIQTLDNNTADRVQSIILSPPQENPYDELKKTLTDIFGKSQAEKDQEILDFNGLGDKKPSELLQHMLNLNADPKTLFKAFFLAQLPSEVRRILALSGKTDIKELAKEADKIMEVSKLTGDSQVSAVGESRKPSRQKPRPHHNNRSEPQTTPKNRSETQTTPDQDWPLLPGLCKYHSKFGMRARSCLKPCKLHAISEPGNGPTGRQ